MKVWLFTVPLLLVGCASQPEPVDHAFQHGLNAQGTPTFTFSYFGARNGEGRDGASGGKGAGPQAQEGGRRGQGGRGSGERGGGKRGGGERGTDGKSSGPVPSGEGLTHGQLMLLLEQELDAHQLCSQGYEILEQRPTANGVALRGTCSVK
ncbi:hypothetical protein [Ferrimonas pelagia]|uniref:Lipoprotein n=1 Tax=Ferrimonas pelagia TaxID=1177826 RepID=A0ABP9FMY3_9GAMM